MKRSVNEAPTPTGVAAVVSKTPPFSRAPTLPCSHAPSPAPRIFAPAISLKGHGQAELLPPLVRSIALNAGPSMTVYFNGEFVDKDDVSLSPDDRGFVFADGIYEVLRAENGAFFQEDLHFERMARSLQEIDLTGVDVEAVREAIHSLLYHNDLQDRLAKIYIQVTRGAAPRQHAVPDPPPEPTVYATAQPHTPPLDKWDNGVKAILHPDQRWARCDIKSISLLPNVMATTAARRADAYEAILVRDGFVTEASHSTVVGVFDGTVVTHPLTNHILPSTTRALLLDLCDAHDVPVEEIPIPEADLPDADELMVLGTTTGVMPIVQVDDWTVADGTPGPITRDLQAAFRALEPA